MVDGLIPTGFIRHCPEQVFALTAFATVILLKVSLYLLLLINRVRVEKNLTFAHLQLIRPEFSVKLESTQERRIIELVQRLVNVLDSLSEKDGADDQRITKRYAHFVRNILGPHIAGLRAGASTDTSPTNPSTGARGESQTDGSSVPSNELFLSSPPEPSGLSSHSVEPSASTPSADVPAIIISNSWDEMSASFSSNSTVPMPPILGFSDSDYLAAMMAFPDQSWLM